jgi:hypothetical protein
VQALVIERDRQAALDTRTDAERWLGDPPAKPISPCDAQQRDSGSNKTASWRALTFR